MNQDSILPTPTLAGLLSGLYRLSAAGLERGPAAGAASPQPDWQFYGNLARPWPEYAVAATDGYRSGALDPQAATTLLRSVTDALAVLFYGWSAESSAVPVEIAALYNQGIIAPLTRARAEALGLEPPPGAGAKRCLDACGVHQRRLQATADTLAISATRTFLAAYIEAVTGSFISDALAVIDVVRTAAAAGNGTAAPSRTRAGGCSRKTWTFPEPWGRPRPWPGPPWPPCTWTVRPRRPAQGRRRRRPWTGCAPTVAATSPGAGSWWDSPR